MKLQKKKLNVYIRRLKYVIVNNTKLIDKFVQMLNTSRYLNNTIDPISKKVQTICPKRKKLYYINK